MSGEELLSLLHTYGYAAVFLGSLWTTDTVVMVAGILAHEGYFHLWRLALCAVVASFAGTGVFFFIGRRYGRAFLQSRPRFAALARKTEHFQNKYGMLYLLSYRFFYGLRLASPLLMGVQGMPWSRFLLFNGVGSILWAGLYILLGYCTGFALENILHGMNIRHHLFLAALLLISLAPGFAVLGLSLLEGRRKDKQKA